MEKARQLRVSESVRFFEDTYKKLYGLVTPNQIDLTKPLVQKGLYRSEDRMTVANHQAPVIVIWCGKDSENKASLNTVAAHKEKVTNIATSHWISDILHRAGLDHKFMIFPNTDMDFWKPCPLGKKVYSYAPNYVYGREMVEEIFDEIPYDTILSTSANEYTKEELREVYKDCFIGVRLRQVDGSAASVQEMGLMGRRTVSNVHTPTAIEWRTKEDVIHAINVEANNIGTEQTVMAERLYRFLDVGTEWLRVGWNA